MDLDKYKALLCAVEEGSFSAAARRLGHTTAGVSRMIAVLEEENGFPLLVRSRSGVVPTGDCLCLLPSVRRLLSGSEQCERLSESIRDLGEGRIAVGLAYSADLQWIQEIMEEFHGLFPGIELFLYRGNSEELLRMLEGRSLDLCVVSQKGKNAQWMSLRREELTAWVPAGHPLAEQTEVALEAFWKETYIALQPGADNDGGQILQKNRIRPKTVTVARDRLEALYLVGKGQGIAIQSRQVMVGSRGKAVVRPLEPRQFLDIGIASVRESSVAAETFMTLLRKRLHRREEKGFS